MAHAIIRGGTFSAGDLYLPAGVHEITDAEHLDVLEAAARELPWLTLDWDYTPPLELPLPAGDVEPALPTLGQKLIAETHDGDAADPTAAARIADALTPEPEKPKPGFPCPFCDKTLRNWGGRAAHIRASHPAMYDGYMEEHRRAKAAGEAHEWEQPASAD